MATKSLRITQWIDPHQKARLTAAARQARISHSEIVRRALDTYLKQLDSRQAKNNSAVEPTKSSSQGGSQKEKA
ncbi:ribbon-helix-helix domain-containing protein [Trichocoleus sp. DQ-A3]|uniref:ribbon-helix-helix domain-containing protein n=1 Tax=Cyanophyceae TaxID=3028117 RepID=UPI0016841876|nr:CopG family transcriptional regulator [Coleofasciculus sp. FACHB-125]MBD1903781.1 ribbon-helix-helix domain-containing protein [Coleofasciculus sp. FACHB-125]